MRRSLTALVAFITVIAVFPPAATADHTPDPSSVAVVGSLQDELGCSGEWQPDCAATELSYDAGDGVWQAVFSLPAGSYEYKVALNDSWDENYGAGAAQNGPNIVLVLDTPTDVKFFYDHESHWITDDVNSVIATVPGSFQSQLGCPDNWQPDCLGSWLQDPDGDGLYSFITSAISAGPYQGKVAINESWAENYGVGGVADGPDYTFSVSHGDTVEFLYDPVSHLLTITALDDLAQPPVRVAAQEDVFYFVMPDRFDNGDPANDRGDDTSGDPIYDGFLPTSDKYFHGGDLVGLQGKLDYIQQLGATAIWITPQFKNAWVPRATIEDTWPAYHGYGQVDYSTIDPHFGTNAEMEAFIADAHSRGIKVYFDIVANHTGDVLTYTEGEELEYRNKADYPYRDADGVAFDDADYAGTGTFPTLDAAVSFPYTPAFRTTADETIKSPAWLNDPIYYHHRGQTTFVGEDSLYGDFYGLDDLFTEHPVVQDGLIEIFKGMITDFDVDGFRIDTVKHVNDEFWQAFGTELIAHAESLGKSDFFMFGEVYSGDPTFASRYTTELPLPAVLDFGFHGASLGFAAQSNATDALRDFFASDDWFTDADSNAYALPTFLGNHDLGRIGRELQLYSPDTEWVARDQLAHALMYFARGIPIVYYGDEQGFTGDGGDRGGRQDMMPSLVDSYNDDVLIGTAASTADANFDQTHVLYQTLADYAAVLAAHPALRNGAQLHRYSQDSAGIYAFSRIDRDELVEYVVALNNSAAPASAAFGTSTPGTTFSLVYPGTGPGLTSDAGGQVTVDLAAFGVAIYQADTPVPTSTAAPHIEFVTPDMGGSVYGRTEVSVAVDGPGPAEVTFAVSVDGGPFEPIGTDDNAPYRVFFDVDAYPVGTSLAFKAVVDDLAGHYDADTVMVLVGEEPPAPEGPPYAAIHYLRDDGDYGDHTTGDYNDFWGLHLWGDIQETINWTAPKPFLGEDEYGRFAWVRLTPDASNVGFIVHKGDVKDGTEADRFFDPSATTEIWLRSDDATIYTSRAEAQGYVTIHYHRDDGDYGDPTSPDYNNYWGLHLWGDAIGSGVGTDWTSPRPFDGVDDFGAFWNVPIDIANAGLPVNFIIHRGDTKDPGPDQSMVPLDDASIWILSGDETIYAQQGQAQGFATIHYHRPAGDYGNYASSDFNDFWGLHTWNAADDPGWTTPRKPDIFDTFGVGFTVPLIGEPTGLPYILHRGDEKDPGPDQFLAFDEWGYEVWQLQGERPLDPDVPHYVLPLPDTRFRPQGDIGEQRAHWVSSDTIVWDPAPGGTVFELVYGDMGGLTLTDGGIDGGSRIVLTPGGPFDPADPAFGREGFNHLAGLPTFTVGTDAETVKGIITGQIAVLATNTLGRVDATGLQISGALDDLYAGAAYAEPLGVVWAGATPELRVWAPTARSVTLHLFADADPATTGTTAPMTFDPATGIWSISGDTSWDGQYYLYEVEVYVHSTGQVEHNLVTDPYSVGLSMNSARSLIVDLSDPALAPDGWDGLEKPPLAAPEDISLYELHVRDFSAGDPSVPDELQGTFKAFTLEGTYGTNHLEALAAAGLTHLHLLPAFDIATINENKAEWQEADPSVLETYPPDSDQQQLLVTQYEELDGFNWGYDPWHYTVPEGSYSTDPDGVARIVEFREMVQALNNDGIRVVMDVVYNHTNASGQADKSVLDRVVPGYYHRLNDVGAVETSTCCANTATEFLMMEKLMIDSVVTWADAYQVDGFRFDLMGHHSLQNMLNVQQALADIGRPDIYLYGEGWNFGEVADNARFKQATQLEIGGTGIGTFNDRLRDAVRGGGPFDGGNDLIRNQGFINGLFYDSNVLNAAPEPDPEPASVTIVGNLQDELGCSGDWQPDCPATYLGLDPGDGVWQATWTVPAGNWEYKAALNDSWAENYGAGAVRDGPNIGLSLSTDTDVKFYYSTATHWVTDNINAVIATVPGSFQSFLGCSGDWQPDCLQSWLQDPDGDGIYSFSTSLIPPGDYEAKVAIDESWDVNYGEGGVQNGPNIPFSVAAGETVSFSYDSASHILTIGFGASDQLADLLQSADQIRVGLAGNLAGYQFEDRNGNPVTGYDVDYNGAPAGYTLDPQENIVYVAAHDNQTLFDISQYKHPVATSMEDRVRAQNLGIDLTVLSQGVPFLHAGVDMLRSKSLDRDSYNSGDWFNRLDFTYQDNNWGVGLPVAGKNQDNWPLMQPLLADPALKPAPEHIQAAVEHTQEMLEIRNSSPLFRLQTEADVQNLLRFHNTGPTQLPGLIVMSLGDLADPYAGNGVAVVLFNANDEAQSFTIAELAGTILDLHVVQANGSDEVVKGATYDFNTGSFMVPARTTAVFMLDQTPPIVEAAATQQSGSNNVGLFELSFSCTDNDPEAVTVAYLNGIEVENGQLVRLIENPGSGWVKWIDGILNIKAPSFELVVTCTDRADNTTTEVVPLEFEVIPGTIPE